MKHIYFILLLIGTTVSAQNNITFSVDMSGQTFTTPYVSGSFNSWSGDANALTNVGGDIWEATLSLPDGEYEYKFTYDNWAGQDAFSQGDVCTITNYGNHNRRLVVEGSDMVLETAPFSSCYENTTGPSSFTVNFVVDMYGYGGSFTNVHINGENHNGQGFGNWCGDCGNTLTDMGGGMYGITLTLEEYSYQFKITVDAWTDQENFSPGDPYTATDGTYTNRYIQVNEDKTINLEWNVAGQETLGVSSVVEDKFSVYPNPTQGNWKLSGTNVIKNVIVYDILGKQVLSMDSNANEVVINGASLKTGVYMAKIESENGSKTIKLIKN
ncbi:T9SS type A sorting domain-containing protein [Winogradskyella marincola]|uniref:T9SS type A sorting domain-containing protein n=2 Tax=Flavobacteriaceae TaxID=49546 RepID=A0ABT6G1E9_9FLAO|nr:T9SS type A sorting domain-containing protein [Winogradskyella sp. YYF002]MDG4715864.1 T9SS type A sorting domain-containing protein [Winogradskyella sp. YYF002]